MSWNKSIKLFVYQKNVLFPFLDLACATGVAVSFFAFFCYRALEDYIAILKVNSLDPLRDLRLGSRSIPKNITKPNLSIYFLGYQLSMSSKQDD